MLRKKPNLYNGYKFIFVEFLGLVYLVCFLTHTHVEIKLIEEHLSLKN